MKSQRTKITKSKYPEDHKDVLKDYLLRNAMIDKYNKDESNILKFNKHEKIFN